MSREARAACAGPEERRGADKAGRSPPFRHAQPYVSGLPARPHVLQLAEADNFSLCAQCSRETMVNLGEACGRLVGDERQSMARRRDRFLVNFFHTSLGGALPPAAPSGYIAAPRER